MDFIQKYSLLLLHDKTREKDLERKAMFYIFASNNDLYSLVNEFYDFKHHHIKPECLDGNLLLSSSEIKLIELAFSHYNGYPADVFDSFNILDRDNFTIAIDSLIIRYQR